MKKEITLKVAVQIIRNKYIDQSIVECFELSDCYAFDLRDKGRENELCGGGYYTIDKFNGNLGGMTSMKMAFSDAKRVDLNILEQ